VVPREKYAECHAVERCAAAGEKHDAHSLFTVTNSGAPGRAFFGASMLATGEGVRGPKDALRPRTAGVVSTSQTPPAGLRPDARRNQPILRLRPISYAVERTFYGVVSSFYCISYGVISTRSAWCARNSEAWRVQWSV
jgi:hypothetical protein